MYTIQVLSSHDIDRVRRHLEDKVAKDGRFRIGTLSQGVSALTRKERREAVVEMWEVPTLYLQRIRLKEAKPYCGNHPGPCVLTGQKKPTSTLMEWDDWVAFHTLVNKVLDQLHVKANVWTLPYDVKGKMWIRKGTHARVRWDYTEEYDGRIQPLRHWNVGTPDQFQEAT
jgi:hypothetical protein